MRLKKLQKNLARFVLLISLDIIKHLELQYRGRFKELKDLKPINNKDSDLKLAMKMIAETQKGPDEQVPSVGCSIKWFN